MWHPIRAFGFIYYEAFLSPGAICWITREKATDRYVIFYCDGKHKEAGTRGSQKNARALAAELVAKYKP